MESVTRTLAGLVVAILASIVPLAGTYALLGGKAAVVAHLNADHGPGSNVHLDVYQTREGSAAPIRRYDLDMTKDMHMIVLRDDFATFAHVHPAFDAATGHFTIVVPMPRGHAYYIYTDSQPTGIGQQVFRFTYDAGAGSVHAPVGLDEASPTKAQVGRYSVRLAATTIPATTPHTIDVTIERDGKLATGLRPYLGAAAHAVFINTATLAYVHVHPMVQGATMSMPMSGMQMDDDGPAQAGPKLSMHVPALPAGAYRLWLQFQGPDGLQTVPFTLVAR